MAKLREKWGLFPSHLKKMYFFSLVCIIPAIYCLIHMITSLSRLLGSWSSFHCVTPSIIHDPVCEPVTFVTDAYNVLDTMFPAFFGLYLFTITIVEHLRSRSKNDTRSLKFFYIMFMFLPPIIPYLFLGVGGSILVQPYLECQGHGEHLNCLPNEYGAFETMTIIGFSSCVVFGAMLFGAIIANREREAVKRSIHQSSVTNAVVNRKKFLLQNLVRKLEKAEDDANFDVIMKEFNNLAFQQTFLWDKINQEHVFLFEYLHPSEYSLIEDRLIEYNKKNELHRREMEKFSSFLKGTLNRSVNPRPKKKEARLRK